MSKLLNEQFVQDCIIEYLSRKGWSRNLKSKSTKQQGVDIRVRNNKVSRYWLVEVKGDASKTAKNPRSRREVNFNLVLGQILTRMHTDGKPNYKYRYKYGVGLPTSHRDKVVRRLPYDACNKLNLYIFLVNEDKKVEMLDWKKLKKMQTK